MAKQLGVENRFAIDGNAISGLSYSVAIFGDGSGAVFSKFSIL
ncbi:hypothetical protein JCM19238_894 [Vibrio ponticus]|nr:hypothetical protein JCM19238_894 [Vibrio ponticus]